MEEQHDQEMAKSSGHNIDIGKRGEDAACMFIEREGFEILERNWWCASGEADIIALDDGVLVFIEVKTRSGDIAGLPEESVTPEKRRKYEEIALAYLRASDFGNTFIRFDVASITLLDENRAMLRYHRNSFGVGD